MFKKITRTVAIILVMCMTLVACGGKDTANNNTQSSGNSQNQANNESGSNTGSGKSITELKLGLNNYYKGIYSVDILENGFVETCKALGIQTMVVNDEGKVEKTVQNIDNMISAGVDGIVFFAYPRHCSL